MPSVLVRRNAPVVAWSGLVVVWVLALPVAARALCCNQPGSPTLTPAEMNANLVCSSTSNPCVILAQTIDGPGICSVKGCALDFGSRSLVLDGPFVVPSGTLAIDAGTITVNKAVTAGGPDVAIELNASGETCGSGAGDVVIRQSIDVSSTSAGFIRVGAGCRIVLETSGQLIANASNGTGGTIDLRAGTTITQGATIRAIGAGADGGSVSLTGGDDVAVQRTIDVHSNGDGEGGFINLRAGDEQLDGLVDGGALTVAADLIADGSPDSEGDSGEDGGSISLEATGAVTVASSATIRANGGAPDGAGGSLSLLTQESPAGVLTAHDGNVTLSGPIVMRGATNGDGGDFDGTIGNVFRLQGTVDVSAGGDDATAGNFILTSGGDLHLDGSVSANGRVTTASGGFVQVRAGFASHATLTAAKNLDVSAGGGSDAGDVVLAGCRLTATGTTFVDARSSLPSTRPVITLAATDTLAVADGSRFLGPAGPGTIITKTTDTSVSIASGAVIDPGPVSTVLPADRLPFPPCPVCGDGVRQPGEPCDPGAGADGACCSADCLTISCLTPTRSPTPTPLSTGPTPTPTLTALRTPTRTPTPTATVTPGPPPLQLRPVLGCERAIAKGSTRVVGTELAFLEGCSVDALGCSLVEAGERTACLARAGRRCQSRFTKLTRARRSFALAFAKACAGDPPAVAFPLLRAPDVLAFETLDATCADEVGIVLTSPSALLACVERAACAGERALAVAIPQLAELLPRVFDAAGAGLCLTPAAAPREVRASRSALRCQRAIIAATHKLFIRQLAIAEKCADSLLACRLATGGTAGCMAIADRCHRKLAAFADTQDGPRARLAAGMARTCVGVEPAAVFSTDGLGFADVAGTCTGFGLPVPQTPAELAPCLGAVYGCAAGVVARRAVPAVDGELARYGLALGDDYACAVPSVSPTPTTTPGPDGTRTATPIATATPTIAPTANAVTLLVPGSGTAVTDCVGEWTVRSAAIDPPPTNRVDCTDGDPSCDGDGVANGTCELALGVCLGGTDPNLPTCPLAGGIVSFALQSPNAETPSAQAVLAVVSDLVGMPPGGTGHNSYLFDPPLVLTPLQHCSAPATIVIDRRGLAERTERFRSRTIASTGADDSDTLYLTCLAPGP